MMSDEALEIIVELFPSLERYCYFPTLSRSESSPHILTHQTILIMCNRLDIDGERVTVEALKFLPKMQHLRFLSVDVEVSHLTCLCVLVCL